MFNSEGWPVMAPFRYAPLSASPTAVVAEVTNADVAGAYKVINHGKDISAQINRSPHPHPAPFQRISIW